MVRFRRIMNQENQLTHIKPTNSWALEIKELLASRELLYFFTWRNFKIRYKQTIAGALWSVFKPLALMVVFTLIFSRNAEVRGDIDIPYPVFSYAGLLYWNFFSQTVTQVSSSLINYQNIIKKIYFPRVLVPLSTALTGLVDFMLSAGVFSVLLLFYSVDISVYGLLLFLPLALFTLIVVLSVGLFMSALNIRYRDVQQLMPFLVQVLLFITPVIYSVSFVPTNLQWILFVNPMTAVIELSRYSLLGIGSVNPMNILISVFSAGVIMCIGLFFFKNQERNFEDLI